MTSTPRQVPFISLSYFRSRCPHFLGVLKVLPNLVRTLELASSAVEASFEAGRGDFTGFSMRFPFGRPRFLTVGSVRLVSTMITSRTLSSEDLFERLADASTSGSDARVGGLWVSRAGKRTFCSFCTMPALRACDSLSNPSVVGIVRCSGSVAFGNCSWVPSEATFGRGYCGVGGGGRGAMG